jgi:hypothetical protein
VTNNGNFYDLDDEPTVDILDSSSTEVLGLTDLTTTKVKKGIYKVRFAIDGESIDGKRFFYDKWKGLTIDGVSVSNVTQKFIPKPFTNSFTIGENQTELERYSVQFFGIKMSEKIKRGELRKVVVTFRSINTPKTVLLSNAYYRLFIKEGLTQVNIHDWTQIDVTNENSFVFDTSMYIPREYFLEIKGKTHTEEIFYNETIEFEIVSEK